MPSCRLDDNHLCGVDQNSNGTYSSQGITMLCEVVKGSDVTFRWSDSYARIIITALSPMTCNVT
jgi:hypothetical protein